MQDCLGNATGRTLDSTPKRNAGGKREKQISAFLENGPMPLTGSTIYGGGTFRKVFGLISSSSTDGTALSLTMTHGLTNVPTLNATQATQLIEANFEPHTSNTGGPYNWFVASVNETIIVFGRGINPNAGQAATVETWAHVHLNHSIVQ